MVSLKKYTKEQILTEGNNRFKKIASMLDKEDLEDMLQQALSWLDEAIFTPRQILVKPEDFIEYKGGHFVDVSNQKMDVINNVYYQNDFNEQINTVLPEIGGIIPFILGANGFANLSSVYDYIALRSNLNGMIRQLELDGDGELWDRDEEGHQLLQLRKVGLTKIEYLPSIDRNDEYWYLYDFEYAALKDVLFDMCNLFNAEMQMSAQALGVGKESEGIAKYWQDKLNKDKEEFSNKALVTYIA